MTEDALIKRINRKLAPDGQQLRKARGQRAVLDVGEFYMHDRQRNIILQTNVDPEAYARELGVLASEVVAS
jgi:hypothetical protein